MDWTTRPRPEMLLRGLWFESESDMAAEVAAAAAATKLAVALASAWSLADLAGPKGLYSPGPRSDKSASRPPNDERRLTQSGNCCQMSCTGSLFSLKALKRIASCVARAVPAKAQSHSDSLEAEAHLLQQDAAQERDVGSPTETRGDCGDVEVDAVVDEGSDTVTAVFSGRTGVLLTLDFCSCSATNRGLKELGGAEVAARSQSKPDGSAIALRAARKRPRFPAPMVMGRFVKSRMSVDGSELLFEVIL